MDKTHYLVAQYSRLSREDGDRPESDSIVNQQLLLDDYCAAHSDMRVVQQYSDDGYTGTNFDRPAFRRMLLDIETGAINCVIVKDLSRFGRDYIDMGYYLERWFPSHHVRFIAINDGVDSLNGPYDMLLPLKNVFNTQYAKDISQKVKTSFRAKQARGEFIGAFACYGYRKDPENHNHLVIDPVAAQVVLRIFKMAAQGVGQLRIAKQLNQDGVPCPSEYKRLMGTRYHNCNKLDSTTYWTYATVHRMLANRMYLGDMVQARAVRTEMHGKATAADPSAWITVQGTHEPIISRELWDTVQAQHSKNCRVPAFGQKVGLFAGFLKCGDCGRAMVKTVRNGKASYSCGSYKRYGPNVCSKHYIPEEDLVRIILDDLNFAVRSIPDLDTLIQEECKSPVAPSTQNAEREQLNTALNRIRSLKQSSYEDYRDKLLTREEFIRYKADYDRQECTLAEQLNALVLAADQAETDAPSWVNQLAKNGGLLDLDRATIAEAVKEIRVFEENRIEIEYKFECNQHSP